MDVAMCRCMDREEVSEALERRARLERMRTRFQEGLVKLTRVQKKLCVIPPRPLSASSSYFTSSRLLVA